MADQARGIATPNLIGEYDLNEKGSADALRGVCRADLVVCTSRLVPCETDASVLCACADVDLFLLPCFVCVMDGGGNLERKPRVVHADKLATDQVVVGPLSGPAGRQRDKAKLVEERVPDSAQRILQ